LSTDAIVTHLVAGIAVIMLLGMVFGAAARRIGQPTVVGQILAGILLGPSLLGRLPGHLTDALFPAPTMGGSLDVDRQGRPSFPAKSRAASAPGSSAFDDLPSLRLGQAARSRPLSAQARWTARISVTVG
jgi:hypothetical protein